jgi:hypothetical protein
MPGKRPPVPKCTSCNHPLSFHGLTGAKCQALGCTCRRFTGSKKPPKPVAIDPPSAQRQKASQ